MTQQRIRYVTGLFLTACTAVFAVTILYMNAAEEHALQRIYLNEMLRRVGYVSALINWLPEPDLLDPSELDVIGSLAPFSLGMLTEEESAERLMSVTRSFPNTAYEYSEPLRRVIFVQETFTKQPVLGCPGQSFLVGVSVVFLAVTLVVAFVKLSNLLAASAYAMQSRTKMLLARVSVVVALVIPIGFGVLMLYAMTQSQSICAVRGWQDDIRRTAMLVGELYGVLLSHFRLYIPKQALLSTMASINAALIGDIVYSAHIIDYAAQTVSPPLEDAVVMENLLDAQVSQVRFSMYLPKKDMILAAHSLPEQSLMLGVVKSVADDKPRMSSEVTKLGLLIMLVPIAVVTLVALCFFPYASLGKTTCGEEHLGPWASRSSRHWPLWKLLQAALLVGFAVFAMACNGERLSFFNRVSNGLTENLSSLIRGSISLSTLGHMLLDNYNMMMRGLDWSTNYVDQLANTTDEVKAEVNRFYQSVFTTLEASVYSASSAADVAATRAEEQLPFLMNKEQVVAFLTTHLSSGDAVTYLEAFIVLFDAHTVFHILAADVEGLTMGDEDTIEKIIEYAEALDSDNGETFMTNIIKGTLKGADEYTSIAQAWQQQSKTERDVSDLYATDIGRMVVALEQKLIADHQATWPRQLKYNTLYTYIDPSYIGWPLSAIVVFGAFLALDYLYTARVFGRSRGTRDAATVKLLQDPTQRYKVTDATISAALPPSNDYTAPRSFLNVNHFQLWRNVRWGSLLSVAVGVLCGVFTIACLVASLTDVRNIIDMRSYEEQSASPTLETARSAGMMHASTAAWMRAYLSRLESDVIAAMQLTYAWAKTAETEWVDERPVTTDDRFTTELTDVSATMAEAEKSELSLRNNLRQMSNLVFAHLSAKLSGNDLDSVYQDFTQLIPEYDTVLPIATLYACTTPDAEAFLTFSRFLRDAALDLLYMRGDEYMEKLVEDVLAFVAANPQCALDAEAIELHLFRCSLLRRRAVFFTPRQQLASTLTSSSELTTEDAIASVEASTGIVSVKEFKNASAAWLPLVMAWLCCPLVLLILRTAQAVHRSIYYS